MSDLIDYLFVLYISIIFLIDTSSTCELQSTKEKLTADLFGRPSNADGRRVLSVVCTIADVIETPHTVPNCHFQIVLATTQPIVHIKGSKAWDNPCQEKHCLCNALK